MTTNDVYRRCKRIISNQANKLSKLKITIIRLTKLAALYRDILKQSSNSITISSKLRIIKSVDKYIIIYASIYICSCRVH